MVEAEPTTPPTLDDARRAADALVEAGAARVLLYGSVARGDATSYSDIDLVAVFADLGDYGERRVLRERLTVAATAAAGRECDVHVTDVCEWLWRVERVSASFEHDVSGDCVCLRETPKILSRPARKPIGMPTSNVDEAVSQLDGWVLSELRTVRRTLRPDEFEVAAARAGDEASVAVERGERHVVICTAASMAVEKSLKVLMLAGGERPPDDRHLKDVSHNIAAALNALDDRTKYLMTYAVTSRGLTPGALSKWRAGATYPDDIDVWREEALAKADTYVTTAMIVAHMMDDELARRGAKPADLAKFRRDINAIWKLYADTDPFDGQPRVTPLPSSPLPENRALPR